MKKLFKSIILSGALLMGAAAFAPSASAKDGPAGKMNPGTAAECLRMRRLTRPAPQRWIGKPRKKAQALFITRPAYTRSAPAAGLLIRIWYSGAASKRQRL